ncbi:metal ABC transporter ATP-binding protein [Larsenimonas rhizosphaerae]|uniref:Metal ABC transporter ATP-binding protein n=1 Tax=Larsenimonas rhizosphaerae TaxID=2944682 RepID=A0AA41ZG82_9GAMM|nr:metal ABC transporter ATP-binding protein [Larsenimonas rhizosphaerae]MCX2523323.1 metal ABC transporter ATP-binding protein [Larsenimonas rhizosphaerae]
MTGTPSTEGVAAIDIQHLGVRYANGHLALEDITLTLAPGEVCALIGTNGSGKSTLCKALLGLIRPTTGSISVQGGPIAQARRRGSIAYVPQAEDVDWDFPVSVRDVVMMGRQGHMNWLRLARRHDHALVMAALERLDITALADRQIGELSGGQKKRVFLARALAQQAAILVLDEPFTGVDVGTEQCIQSLVRDQGREGMAVLVVTHGLASLAQYCDSVAMIHQRMIAAGPVDTTLTQANFQAAFGGHPMMMTDEAH